MAFIWVATMIPGLLLGLKANSIDYDAVAYRTGVILVEDPGWPASPSWESYTDYEKHDISRFGLAVSKEAPNLLTVEKVNRFFCVSTTDPNQGFLYPDDYRTRAIFGDELYMFNISLDDIDNNRTYTVGDRLPTDFGYIRRLVKLKGPSNSTIGAYQIARHHFNNTDNVQYHEFTIFFNSTNLSTYEKDPAYQINPAREQTIVNITDMQSAMTIKAANIYLHDFKVYKQDSSGFSEVPLLAEAQAYPYIDGNSSRVDTLAHNIQIKNNISIMITPHTLWAMQAAYSKLYVNLTFYLDSPDTFINTTNNHYTIPFDYNYDPSDVTQPKLRPAVVEVSVW